MPSYRTYTGLTIITCAHCGVRAETYEYNSRDGVDTNGTPLADTFVFSNQSGHFFNNCRACGNARRNNAQRRTGRVVGTFRSGLGNLRKFGVELETVNNSGVSHLMVVEALSRAGLNASRANYSASNTSAWLVKSDGSLTGGTGIEITSPALSGPAGMEQLRTACRVLNELGLTVNTSCGTHVHHDAADLTIAEIKRFVTGWAAQQTITDGLVSPSRRNGAAYYARPLARHEVQTIQNATTLRQIRHTSIDRYRTLNLKAYGKFGTMEIRQHQGTLSFAKIAAWVALGQAMIDTAIAGDTLATPATTARGMFDLLGSRLNETARTFLTGRAVDFGAVAV